jgi:hypothetical protein
LTPEKRCFRVTISKVSEKQSFIAVVNNFCGKAVEKPVETNPGAVKPAPFNILLIF